MQFFIEVYQEGFGSYASFPEVEKEFNFVDTVFAHHFGEFIHFVYLEFEAIDISKTVEDVMMIEKTLIIRGLYWLLLHDTSCILSFLRTSLDETNAQLKGGIFVVGRLFDHAHIIYDNICSI